MPTRRYRLRPLLLGSWLLILGAAMPACTKLKVILGSKSNGHTESREGAFDRAKCTETSTLNDIQKKELIELTDTTALVADKFEDAERRVTRIAEIFSEAKDRRGIFASMYVHTTKRSVLTIQETLAGKQKHYGDVALAKQLVVEFARRYLDALHGHLTGQKISEQWRTYYALATDCKVSDLRILGTGVNTHLTFDLPWTVSEIKAPQSFERDFLKFGGLLLEVKDECIALLEKQQDVYAADFFSAFFFTDEKLAGRIVDHLFGPAAISRLGFKLIRAEAWENGQELQNEKTEGRSKSGIVAAWLARQEILQIVPSSKP